MAALMLGEAAMVQMVQKLFPGVRLRKVVAEISAKRGLTQWGLCAYVRAGAARVHAHAR